MSACVPQRPKNLLTRDRSNPMGLPFPLFTFPTSSSGSAKPGGLCSPSPCLHLPWPTSSLWMPGLLFPRKLLYQNPTAPTHVSLHGRYYRTLAYSFLCRYLYMFGLVDLDPSLGLGIPENRGLYLYQNVWGFLMGQGLHWPQQTGRFLRT